MPQIASAFNGWQQSITIEKITSSIVDFKRVEAATVIEFKGPVQPLKTQDLAIKPIETRAWQWLMIHTKDNIELKVGDKITYDSLKYKVMNKNNYKLNGYFEYHIVEEFNNG